MYTNFEQELENFRKKFINMATLVEEAVRKSIDAFILRDSGKAQEVIDGGACEIKIDIKLYLEGPYNTSSSNMNSNIATSISLTAPYSQDAVTVDSIPPNVVDWVLVELRDKTDNTKIITSRSAFVLNNGDVVDIDGTSPVGFDISADDYFIAVKHRNHLAVMSNAVILVN